MNQPGFNGMPCKALVHFAHMFPGSFVSGDQVFGGKAPYVCLSLFVQAQAQNRLDKQTKS